jgi:dTDP-4-amino-4,6-dideoxygalactose transaminase
MYHGKYAGTLAHIGGYSLNYHKHIHTGEGGILVTDDDELAERMRMIRNHAEAVVGARGYENLSNMIGYNFRLGEIESAIGIEQLKKLSGFVSTRQRAAQQLSAGLQGLNGLRTPIVEEGCSHAYYVYAMTLDTAALGVPRARILEALVSEGVQGLSAAYQNLHLLPMYQKKIAYGSKGFPWSSDICRREVSYAKGICPVAEALNDSTYLGFAMCLHEMSDAEVDLLVSAFRKVWAHLPALAALESHPAR